jgi:hypothetical protein
LGAVHRRPWLIFSGFAIFTILDGIATAVHLSGKLGTFSMWWIELAFLPMALLSIPVIWWCYANWSGHREPDAQHTALDAATA